MPRPVAWSYSRLKNFELCPKKYNAVMVAKTVKEPESEELAYGSKVHKELELRIGKGRAFSKGFEWLERYARMFDDADGQVMVEQQLAINTDLDPCDWKDWNNCYCRAIADVMVVGEKTAVAVDWKTGRIQEDRDQMDILAFVIFQHYPKLEKVKLCYGWIKERDITTYVLTREEASEKWSSMTPRVRKLIEAHRESHFPARPNGTCRRWCPVTACPHNGRHQQAA